MRKTLFLLFLLASLCLHAETRTRFNADWLFILQDDSLFSLPESQETGWQRIDLPHDWSIAFAPTPTAPASNDGGWYPTGIGWYRKHFQLTAKEAAVFNRNLYFEGVYERADIYINGHHVAHHDYGYTSFSAHLSGYVRQGDNVVAVRVDNGNQKNCRWYSGSGIYRNVWMVESGEHFLSPELIHITTPDLQTITIQTEVGNGSDFAGEWHLVAEVEGQTLMSNVTCEGNSYAPITQSFHIPHPRLWTPSSPELYHIHLSLREKESGQILDESDITCGIRTIEYDAQQGFRLNGQPLLINGACVHHDHGLLGAAAFDAAEVRKVRLMKEAGFNLLRTSHNPPSPAFLNACDSLGMLVIDEAFDGWRTEKNKQDFHLFFDAQAEEEMRSMVRRDRNHPSIIAWSIGNEVIERKDIRIIHTAKLLKQAALSLDTTRPITEALCAWDSDWEIYDPHAAVLDIAGYNYMIHKHEGDHQRVPERVIWQTESYPADAFKNWSIVRDNPYVIGDIVWTGLDYLGESGIGGWRYASWPQGEHWQNSQWPWHGAYCGDVDITGHRKPISYYRSLLWNGTLNATASAPLPRSVQSNASCLKNKGEVGGGAALFLSVREPSGYVEPIKTTMWSTWPTWESWTWPGWEGKDIEVEVLSRYPKIRLYVNEKRVAERPTTEAEEFRAIIRTTYSPGVLRAVGIDHEGREAESTALVTATPATSIRLTADRTVYHADGEDLAYVTVEMTDQSGNVCPLASHILTASLHGDASLAAFGSADLRDVTSVKTLSHAVWHGRALLILRAPRRAGTTTLNISTSGLPKATLNLKFTR